MSQERRQQEISLLRRKYGEVESGQNMDWILIRQFPLPKGWNREATGLLVIIPSGYPSTPPDNFYVKTGLRLQSGQFPGNYSESQTVLGSTWGQFSFHAERWNPAPDLADGDNLLTFMMAVERRLQELN